MTMLYLDWRCFLLNKCVPRRCTGDIARHAINHSATLMDCWTADCCVSSWLPPVTASWTTLNQLNKSADLSFEPYHATSLTISCIIIFCEIRFSRLRVIVLRNFAILLSHLRDLLSLEIVVVVKNPCYYFPLELSILRSSKSKILVFKMSIRSRYELFTFFLTKDFIEDIWGNFCVKKSSWHTWPIICCANMEVHNTNQIPFLTQMF